MKEARNTIHDSFQLIRNSLSECLNYRINARIIPATYSVYGMIYRLVRDNIKAKTSEK